MKYLLNSLEFVKKEWNMKTIQVDFNSTTKLLLNNFGTILEIY
jgi:threonyl-tRNA synthetase